MPSPAEQAERIDWPFISVIIPTYKREGLLVDTLKDLLSVDYPKYEILVIDQTPSHEPATENYLRDLSAKGSIRWQRVSKPSLPAARNLGISLSSGEITVFIDDDVRLPPGFLKAHARSYLSNPRVGCVAGRIIACEDPSLLPADLLLDRMPEQVSDPALVWYYHDFTLTRNPQRVLSARGCNMSFRRQIFSEHGLSFDERFSLVSNREEADLCLRLRKLGMIVWYDPEAWLRHLEEPSGGCHDESTRTWKYQINFYRNEFLLGLKNLTPAQCVRFFGRLFACHVLGRPPCTKSSGSLALVARACFYALGFLSALASLTEASCKA